MPDPIKKKRKKLTNVNPKKKMFTAIDGSEHSTVEGRDAYNKSLKQAKKELLKDKIKKDTSAIMRGEEPVSRVFQEVALAALTGGTGGFILSKAKHANKVRKLKKTIKGIDSVDDTKDIVKTIKRKK